MDVLIFRVSVIVELGVFVVFSMVSSFSSTLVVRVITSELQIEKMKSSLCKNMFCNPGK